LALAKILEELAISQPFEWVLEQQLWQVNDGSLFRMLVDITKET
jgi:hypothetical protein